MRRWVLGCLTLVALLLVLVLMLPRSKPLGTGGSSRQFREHRFGAPTLRGHTPTAPESTSASPAPPDGGGEIDRLVAHEIQVLDHGGAAVEGVEVYLERDTNDHSSGSLVRGWRMLDQGTTDMHGRVQLSADPTRRPELKDGLNHRLRVEPPNEREDLAETWRLWMPTAAEVFRFVESHVVAGTVVDASGDPVAGATVFVGDMPDGDYAAVDPEWRKTTTDPQGRFRFAGIPTTSDWKLDVWAVRAGEQKPADSRGIRGALSVALGDRRVMVVLK